MTSLEAEAQAILETNPQPQPPHIVHVPQPLPPPEDDGHVRDKESDDHALLPFEGEESVDLPLTKHWKIKHANALNAEQNQAGLVGNTLVSPNITTIPQQMAKLNYYGAGFTLEPWTPGKPLQLFYGTWNMAQKDCKADEISNNFIAPNAHIIAVCTQENGPYVGSNVAHTRWETVLTSILPEYTRVEAVGMWATHLMVFARTTDVLPYVTEVHTSYVKTGSMGNSLGNKGGIGIGLSIRLYNSQRRGGAIIPNNNVPLDSPAEQPEVHPNHIGTQPAPSSSTIPTAISTTGKSVLTFLFIGAHLTAHQENHAKRNEDYLHIIKHLKLGTTGIYDQRFLKRLRRVTETTKASPLVGTNNNMVSPTSLGNLMSPSMAYTGSNFGRTGRRTYTPLPTRDVTEEFDVCCFFGDLNYRIDGTAGAIRHIIRNHRTLRAALTANDQLVKEMAKGLVFHGFEELPLSFCPTYKLKKIKKDKSKTKFEDKKREKVKSDKIVPVPAGTQIASSSVDSETSDFETPGTYDDDQYEDGPKARMPAYCDRILLKSNFRTMPATAVSMNLYTDVRRVTTSDHRPVALLATAQTELYEGDLNDEDIEPPNLRKGCT